MKKNNQYKIFVVLISLTFLCGCWNIKEINHRGLPLIIGVSKGNEEQYKVTLYLPITEKGSKLSSIVTVEGGSVASVLGKIRTNSENAVDYSQVRLIVIQNNFAKNKQEMKELIKFLMTARELPSIALLAITDDNIEEMFSNINEKFGGHAEHIYNYFNKGTEWAPEVNNTSIWEAYRSLFSYTKDIVVPVINSGKDTLFSYEGSAILKIGELYRRVSPNENLIINLFKYRKANEWIEDLGIASIVVINSSIQMKSSMKMNKPLLSSDVYFKIRILERNEGITNNQIKNKLENLIEKRFYKIFEQAQTNKTDIFGFGQHFRNQIPYQELKDWREEYYPKLKVKFQVHVSLE